jgi:hypothetical protein
VIAVVTVKITARSQPAPRWNLRPEMAADIEMEA